MPVAIVDDEPQRFELKSLPGAFVVVRQMSYGEKIHRQGLSGAMKILRDNKSDFAGEIAMETARLTEWDFANLVVDHNLEDKDGRKLDLRSKQDLHKLSARIGDEVGKYIDDLNSFDDEGN